MEGYKNYSKKIITQAVISRIEEKGRPEEIRTKYLDNYSAPSVIELKNNEEKTEMLYPDIIVEYSNGTHIYEIELDEEIKSQKWKSMALFAEKNNGDFYIIIPDFMRDRVKKTLQEDNIDAALLFFDTRYMSN